MEMSHANLHTAGYTRAVTALEVMAGAVVERLRGCVGQRATAPVGAQPQFVV
jgi:hypothetical protein